MAATAWTTLLVVLMSIGALSTAQIGAISWGPQHDIWSAAIAISEINFGLSGKLAFKEVEQAISDEVTGTKNAWSVMDEETLRRTQSPEAVTRAFQKAAALTKEQIGTLPNPDNYVTDWCEDLGYADFYNLAFRLFGFNAFSTHFLYIAVLLLSVFAFVLVYWRDSLAMAIVVLAVTALFLVSTSSMFDSLTPALAANRFLSTLGLVPLTHLLLAMFRSCRLSRTDIAIVVLQSLLLALTISVRGSAMWQAMAFGGFSLSFAIGRWCRVRRDWTAWREAVARFVRPQYGRALVVTLVVGTVLAVSSWARYQLTDERYFLDDNMPHHLFWHSAWLGLTINPEWSTYKPYPDLPDAGDGAGFRLFEHRMHEMGESAVSLEHHIYSNAYYRARTYEVVIEHEFFSFIYQHPRYAAKLYFYYKPLRFGQIMFRLIASVPLGGGLLAFGSTLLAGALLARSREDRFGFAFVLIWLTSLMPVIWAYPATHTISDPAWATMLLLSAAPAYLFAHLARRVAKGRRLATVTLKL